MRAMPHLADVERILALLPQTQCTKCGYAGCRPYAHAMVDDGAPINRCPPGGAAGIAALAEALERAPMPLDPACGVEGPRRVAFIVESQCIGCTKCIQACPVDAIVGAAKRMHTVIADECTGCDLCVAPCPVDCIEMRDVMPDVMPDAMPHPRQGPAWTPDDARAARARYERRIARLAREHVEQQGRLAARARHKLEEIDARLAHAPNDDDRRKRAIVAAAIERARARAKAAQR